MILVFSLLRTYALPDACSRAPASILFALLSASTDPMVKAEEHLELLHFLTFRFHSPLPYDLHQGLRTKKGGTRRAMGRTTIGTFGVRARARMRARRRVVVGGTCAASIARFLECP
jgi:hypothetical protein